MSNRITDQAEATLERVAGKASQAAEQAIQDGERLARQAADSARDTVASLNSTAPQAMDRAARRAEALTRAGLDQLVALNDSLRDQAHRASRATTHYVQEKPMQSMLIAAAVGAGLLWLAQRSGRRH